MPCPKLPCPKCDTLKCEYRTITPASWASIVEVATLKNSVQKGRSSLSLCPKHYYTNLPVSTACVTLPAYYHKTSYHSPYSAVILILSQKYKSRYLTLV